MSEECKKCEEVKADYYEAMEANRHMGIYMNHIHAAHEHITPEAAKAAIEAYQKAVGDVGIAFAYVLHDKTIIAALEHFLIKS